MSGTVTLDAYGEVTRTTKLAWLAELEGVLQQLLAGRSVANIQNSSLGGGRAVTFRQTDVANVKARIAELRQELGFVLRQRRAIGLRFG